MSKLRSIARRARVAAVAALLLGTVPAPVAAREVNAVEQGGVHKHFWYFDSTRTTMIGEAVLYCDGRFVLLWGGMTNTALIATYDCEIGGGTR